MDIVSKIKYMLDKLWTDNVGCRTRAITLNLFQFNFWKREDSVGVNLIFSDLWDYENTEMLCKLNCKGNEKCSKVMTIISIKYYVDFQWMNEVFTNSGVFPKWNRNLVNSVKSGNLINHWSMNWDQFKDPIYLSLVSCCRCGSILVSYTRGGWFKSFCHNDKYF